VLGFAVNNFESVITALFVAVTLSVDVDSAAFENVDSFVAQRLIDKVIGGKKLMDELVSD